MQYQEWLREWLDIYIKPSSKNRTFCRYEEIICRRLIPQLGEYELEALSPLRIQHYMTELLRSGNLKTGKGLSANSVDGILSVIRSSLKAAYELGLTADYTMNKVKRPKSAERQVSCFSVAEQKILERAAMTDKRDKMKGIVLCLYTGLRIGELLALEWDDIDFDRAELFVKKSCYDGRDEKGAFCRIIDTPKTASSRRVIPLPGSILPVLRDMQESCVSSYVISDAGGTVSVRSYQRSFELLLKKLGIPKRKFHTLRHTFATRAIECGMDAKTLSEILGHKSPAITLNRYVHSLMEHKKEMMDRIGELF